MKITFITEPITKAAEAKVETKGEEKVIGETQAGINEDMDIYCLMLSEI
ncbi:hypothetical protein [Vibrio sp. 10N.286.49.B3]|nr:hypothetical protein [Vibrio sp. 10N.286.49.B3]